MSTKRKEETVKFTNEHCNRLYIFSIIALVLYVALAVNSYTFLRADGCANMMSMLTNKNFYLYDPARNFGQIIKQIFAVIPVRYFGLRDIGVIARLLSFGYAFWTALYYYMAVNLCKRKNSEIGLKCTVFVFSLQITFCGFALITEAILLAAVFWYILLSVLLYDESDEKKRDVFLLGLSIILAYKLYASAFVFHTFVLIVLWLRIVKKQIRISRKILLINCLLIVGSILDAIYALKPSSAKNSWFDCLQYIPKSFFVVMITLICLGIFSIFVHNRNLLMIFGKKDNKMVENKKIKYICYGFEIMLVIEMVYIVLNESVQIAGMNFLTRSLNLFVPLMIGTFMTVLVVWHVMLPSNSYHLSTYAFVICTIVAYTMATTSYSDYLKLLCGVTANQKGFVSASTANIVSNPFYDNWSIPNASVLASTVYSKDNYIHSIVVEEKEWINDAWRPYDCYDIYAYPDLSEYHVYYVTEDFCN